MFLPEKLNQECDRHLVSGVCYIYELGIPICVPSSYPEPQHCLCHLVWNEEEKASNLDAWSYVT